MDVVSRVEIPSEIQERYMNITLKNYILFVNKVVIMMTISNNLKSITPFTYKAGYKSQF